MRVVETANGSSGGIYSVYSLKVCAELVDQFTRESGITPGERAWEIPVSFYLWRGLYYENLSHCANIQ